MAGLSKEAIIAIVAIIVAIMVAVPPIVLALGRRQVHGRRRQPSGKLEVSNPAISTLPWFFQRNETRY